MKYAYSILIIILFFACKGKTDQAAEKNVNQTVETNQLVVSSIQFKNAGLVIGAPRLMEMSNNIRVSGSVDVPPQSMISVSFPLGGYLKSTHLLPGSRVKKGESIAILEDPAYVQLQQDYLIAKARMEYLQADRKRQQELSDQDAASKKVYQQAVADYKIQEVLIRALEEKLIIIGIQPEQLTVHTITRSVQLRSPINGYVTQINVNIGKYVQPSDVLFELVDPNDIHAALNVYEKDIHFIKKGMKAKVALVDRPDNFYDVEVLLVTQSVDEARTGLVHCHFEKTDHDLLPGMFLTGTIALASKKIIAVPEEAVVIYEGKSYVFIQTDSVQYVMQPVQTGWHERGNVEIVDENNVGWLQKKLVIKNAYALLGKLKNKGEEE